MMIVIIWLAVLAAAFMLFVRNKYSRFTKFGVKQFHPRFLVGNVGSQVTRSTHVALDCYKLYNAFPDERFVGKYEFIKPIVFLRDLELIKRVTVKDFEYFLDHQNIIDGDIDPFFGRNLFNLKGQEWKDMRSTLSPAFTSSKMKGMVPFMVEVGDQMMKSLKSKINSSGVGYIDVDTKDLTARYANDVIATCAFGLKVDSHTHENNEFYAMGKKVTNFGFRMILLYLGHTSFPNLMKKLNVKLFSPDAAAFFKNMVIGTMKDREAKHIIRPDMIHLLMEARKGKLSYDEKSNDVDAGFATIEESDVGKNIVQKDWSDIDLVAQAMLFFVAGFETVSSTTSFLLHELAVNPDVQEKLLKEIRENELKTGGKFDYHTIRNLPYLDMCISEVLRLWPPVVGIDRLCIKDYNLGKPNPKSTQDYIVRKGEPVMVPTFSIHHDPEYFLDPFKFDPERFSEENKHKIKPMTYLPFGSGPRNCIGSRFALCEIKIMTYQLLKELELSPGEKTQIPAKLATDSFNLRIEGGHWVRFKVRK